MKHDARLAANAWPSDYRGSVFDRATGRVCLCVILAVIMTIFAIA